MKKLEQKIKRDLFLFLSFFSFLINALSGYILVNNNYKQNINLVYAHMEQQYQSISQRMTVLGENVRFFSEKNPFQTAVAKRQWNRVSTMIVDFLQSSNGIEGVRIYVWKDSVLQCVTSNGSVRFADMPPEELLLKAKAQAENESGAWFLRSGISGRNECLSYLIPIYQDKQPLGYFLADVNVSDFMTRQLGTGIESFGQETLLIRTAGKEWSGDSPWNADLDRRLTAEDNQRFAKKEMLFSAYKLPQSEDFFVQVTSLNLNRIFLLPILALLVLFAASVLVCYFVVRAVTNSISSPLSSLQGKINQTLKEVQKFES